MSLDANPLPKHLWRYNMSLIAPAHWVLGGSYNRTMDAVTAQKLLWNCKKNKVSTRFPDSPDQNLSVHLWDVPENSDPQRPHCVTDLAFTRQDRVTWPVGCVSLIPEWRRILWAQWVTGWIHCSNEINVHYFSCQRFMSWLVGVHLCVTQAHKQWL